MFRIVSVLAVFAALAAPAAAQLWMPAQNRERPTPQSLSRPAEYETFHSEKSGTAFFVDDVGDLLTARHAVNDCTRVIIAKEGRSVAARVVALSPRVDIALIKVPRTLGLAAVFPQNVTTFVNDMVFVSAFDKLAGLKHGGTLANATVIGAPGSSEAGYLAIDSDATFGASGAPVLDSRGLVEGVISRRTTATRVLAVDAAEAKDFLASNGVHFAADDRSQIAGGAPRADRAASISAHVICLQN